MHKFIITDYPEFNFLETTENEEEAIKVLALFLSEHNLSDKYTQNIYKKFKNCLKEAKRQEHFIIEENYLDLDFDLTANSFLETKDFCLLISWAEC